MWILLDLNSCSLHFLAECSKLSCCRSILWPVAALVSEVYVCTGVSNFISFFNDHTGVLQQDIDGINMLLG